MMNVRRIETRNHKEINKIDTCIYFSMFPQSDEPLNQWQKHIDWRVHLDTLLHSASLLFFLVVTHLCSCSSDLLFLTDAFCLDFIIVHFLNRRRSLTSSLARLTVIFLYIYTCAFLIKAVIHSLIHGDVYLTHFFLS
jgi:hypothetical protein